MTKLTESVVEEATIDYFRELDYDYIFGPELMPDGACPERNHFSDVILAGRLEMALARINGDRLPAEALDDAFRKLLHPDAPSLILNNRAFHKMVTDGIDVQYVDKEGRTVSDKAWLFDFEDVDTNDWLVVNQFTVTEGQINRRPDVVVFVNGLPLGVIELKNPADEDATVKTAYNQLQTYKAQIPSLFTFNEALVISDGLEAKLGSLTAPWERFTPWRTIDGETIEPLSVPQLPVLVEGVFEKKRFLDIIRHFVVFEEDAGHIAKKMAAYHQYHAVNCAVEETAKASSPEGDQRIGVVWHTQGSGKSLTMVFYSGKIILHDDMDNPTLVVITDRNDLDDQLFRTFSLSIDLLRQKPIQAESIPHLQELLQKRASGGVIFTTVQKFQPEKGERYPLLSDRKNIVVIADEAHRSQYDFIDGFARNIRDGLPNASFIGFTGTPIELEDRNTRNVFGDHISIYDVERAVEDKTTVPIYYEGRLAKIDLDEAEKPKIDREFEDVTEAEEEREKTRYATKWSRLEALVGTDKRLGLVAQDIIDHYEKRLEAMEGKAMVVCMSRRICVDLYNQIIALRPEWHDPAHEKGQIKVVMTGSAGDPEHYRPHLITKQARKLIETRFKDPKDPLKMVLVRDMWLTGFDVPCLHTMYVDKPMKGHGLMQTIARVNRVFGDKPGGLIVDYLGLAEELKKAMANYTTSGGKGKPTIDQREAVAVMLEKYEILCDIFHGFDWSKFITGKPAEKLAVLPAALEHVLQLDDGAKRVLKYVRELSKAFALAVPQPEALKIQDDLAFFQSVRGKLAEITGGDRKEHREEVDLAIKQIVSKAVSSDEVVDIFKMAGLDRPDISILSDEFLKEVKEIPQKNLAAEMLRKLLNDKIKSLARRNVVQSKAFSERLEETIRRYQNRTIEAAEVITELVKLAKEFKEAMARGEKLDLTEEEIAFYDALGTNDSAVQELGDDTLKAIARELVERVRKSVTIDWTLRESARAKLRVMVKRILRKYNYPPDKQEAATKTVLSQAEVLCKDWAA